MLANHLEPLLTGWGRKLVTGKLPDGGRNNRLFAEAVRRVTSTPGEVPRNLNAKEVEQTAGILVAAYDGLASTTQLSETCKLARATIIGAMKLLSSHESP